MSIDSIQVIVRIRPLTENEINSGCQNIVKKTCNEPQVSVGEARNGASTFTFNHVFSEIDSQGAVYTESVQHMIKKLFEGYNITILAYGQTGTGKTYTMDTNYNGTPSESMGVIPRALIEIFEKATRLEHDLIIKCSFVELYNEQLFDLLSSSTNRDDRIIDLREDTAKGIIMPALTNIEVNSIDKVISCLVKGSDSRSVGATAMNATSSRSHAIFTITLEMANRDNPTIRKSSRLHLVDLAGSERSKKTKATGSRLKEGIKINQGLFALGKCITALSGPNPNSFVQYRESKLTRLLQDSLGGNSFTLLIACISPADYNMEETLNTLNYANRAKNIKNKPIVNYHPDVVDLEIWEKKAQALRLKLLNLNIGNISGLSDDNAGNVSAECWETILLLKNDLQGAQRQNQEFQTGLRNAMISLLNIELKDDLMEKVYNELYEIVHKIDDVISIALKKDISSIWHGSLAYMEGIAQIAGEMKSLLTSVFSGVNKNTEIIGSCEGIVCEEGTSCNNDVNHNISTVIFQKIQLKYTNEIDQLSEQIAIKGVLQKQIQGNLTDNLNLVVQNKIAELENKIKSLETSRSDLENRLIISDKTNKMADTRINEMDKLEKQIQTLVKQHKQQQKLLKLREADTERISQLQTEIKDLKSSRVQITREMSKCNILHSKWRFNKDKEIYKIRGLQKKKLSELSRMSITNERHQNVLKRKSAEIYADIKKLELKIEKKRWVQLSRRRSKMVKTGSFKTGMDEIFAITETEVNLDHLKQNREHMISEIEMLKLENSPQPQEITVAEKQLSQLNKRMTNYHRTIISAKKGDKIKKLVNGIDSIEDEREVVKYLFGEILELNRELSEKNCEFDALIKSNEAGLKKISLLETKQANIKQKFLSDVNAIEQQNEEKIGKVLDEMQLVHKQVEPGNSTCRDKVTKEAVKKKIHFLKIQGELENNNEQLRELLGTLQHKQIITASRNCKLPIEPINCSCTNCRSSKMCKCRKSDANCNDKCKCNKSCSNVGGQDIKNDDGESKNWINISKADDTVKCTDLIGDKRMLKELEVSTRKSDVTMPRYPYENKKRIPFYRMD